jgi:hypothetical protein
MNIFSILKNLDEYIERRRELESETYLAMLGSLNLKDSHMLISGNPWKKDPSDKLMKPADAEALPDLSNMLQMSCGNIAGLGCITYHHDSTGAVTGRDEQIGDLNFHFDAAGHQTGFDDQT